MGEAHTDRIRVKYQDVVGEQLLGSAEDRITSEKNSSVADSIFSNSFSAISFKFFLYENGQFMIMLKNFLKRINAFSFDF